MIRKDSFCSSLWRRLTPRACLGQRPPPCPRPHEASGGETRRSTQVVVRVHDAQADLMNVDLVSAVVVCGEIPLRAWRMRMSSFHFFVQMIHTIHGEFTESSTKAN